MRYGLEVGGARWHGGRRCRWRPTIAPEGMPLAVELAPACALDRSSHSDGWQTGAITCLAVRERLEPEERPAALKVLDETVLGEKKKKTSVSRFVQCASMLYASVSAPVIAATRTMADSTRDAQGA